MLDILIELGDLPITSLPLRDLGDLSEFLLCLSWDFQGEKKNALIKKSSVGKIANVFCACTDSYEKNERFEKTRKVVREYITVYYFFPKIDKTYKREAV